MSSEYTNVKEAMDFMKNVMQSAYDMEKNFAKKTREFFNLRAALIGWNIAYFGSLIIGIILIIRKIKRG